jgi:hypothetical protein
MPILTVRGLPQKLPLRIPQALGRACTSIAEAYGCKPNQVWGTWQEITPGWYVEGDNAATVQPAVGFPPIAELACPAGKPPEVIEKCLLAAAKALAEGLGLGDNVFVAYRELKAGEIIAGDSAIRKAG